MYGTPSIFSSLTCTVEVNPYSAHAFFNKANLHRSMGDIEKAAKDYKQGINVHFSEYEQSYCCIIVHVQCRSDQVKVVNVPSAT